MLGLSLSLHPRLLTALHCKVCQQYIGTEARDEAAIEARLFGAAKYAVCPSCGMEVAAPYDRNYKARWTRFVNRRNRNQ